MELSQIRYFLCLCEELNFTKAAERCNVAQPSLTRAIKLLEDEFGGALFYRERANTRLTELGHMVRPHLDEVHGRSQLVKREAADFGKAARTRLSLGVMCTIAPSTILELVSHVYDRHPDIDLNIIDSNAWQLEEKLVQGDIDIAIYCRPDHENERLHYVKLFREQMMAVLAPSHPLASRNVVSFKDLEQERYLNRVNCEYNEGAAWKDCNVTWRAVCRSERDDWILAMAAAGLGFGFLPEFCVTHPGVVARPVIEPEFWRQVSVVTVRGRPHSPAVGAIVHEAMRTQWFGQKSPEAEAALRRSKAQGVPPPR
jgi:LysR family hydrogen peroxide-inducible transcriptional activator